MLAPWKKSHNKPRQHIKKQRHHFANKGPNSQSYGISSSHIWIWELGHKEGWAPSHVNGYQFEQTPGDSEGEGSLVCCSPRGHKELDMT